MQSPACSVVARRLDSSKVRSNHRRGSPSSVRPGDGILTRPASNQGILTLTSLNCSDGEYRIELFCAYFMSEADDVVQASPETLKVLGDRRIMLELCIYAPATEN